MCDIDIARFQVHKISWSWPWNLA